MSIENSKFVNSEAFEKGGAINYEMYWPFFRNNSFSNNKALYGPDIASYGSKLKVNGSYYLSIKNVGSS